MTVIFSGIQPTGRKHLGNYVGAIEQYVAGQDYGDPAIYCVVDSHAITVAYDPVELRARTYDTAAILVAAGLDPQRCVLFRQSDLAEHTELAWLLSSVTELGRLNRMHQFRDKSQAQRQLVSAGLLFYPVLMAADILAYNAQDIPVGEDQREHVEVARDIAARFNSRYGDTFVLPETKTPAVGARVMDLQEPTRKMSTSGGTEQGTVLVLDDTDVLMRKFKRAVTDSENEIRHSPSDKPGVSNLLELYASATATGVAEAEAHFADARGYGDLKVGVGEAVDAKLRPVRERYAQLRADEAALEQVLAVGADKARAICRPIVAGARARMGLGSV